MPGSSHEVTRILKGGLLKAAGSDASHASPAHLQVSPSLSLPTSSCWPSAPPATALKAVRAQNPEIKSLSLSHSSHTSLFTTVVVSSGLFPSQLVFHSASKQPTSTQTYGIRLKTYPDTTVGEGCLAESGKNKSPPGCFENKQSSDKIPDQLLVG